MGDRRQPTPPPTNQRRPDPPPAPPPREQCTVHLTSSALRERERRAFMAGRASGVHGDQDTEQAFEDYLRQQR